MAAEVVRPRGKGVLILDAHPDGCERLVELAATAVGELASEREQPPTVLVIGCSSGYGLAMAITGVVGARMSGVGLCLERPPTEKKGGTAGWYRTGALAGLAKRSGADIEVHNADCFSVDTKAAVLDRFAERFGPIDYLVYSVAAPRRTTPDGVTYQSVIRSVGGPHTTYSLNFDEDGSALRTIEVVPATDLEIEATVKVMGGEDWADWVEAAAARGLLRTGATTVALSYVGSSLTAPIYRHGTIGAAKDHLEHTARRLTDTVLAPLGASAITSVNGAAVTQASTAIPGIALYIALLHSSLGKDMQSPVTQSVRLWRHLLGTDPLNPDDLGRLRLDDWEFAPGVQEDVHRRWTNAVEAGQISDAEADWFRSEVHRLYGFAVEGIDYAEPTELNRPWPA